MDAAATDRSPLAEEQLDLESPNLDNDYTVGPTGPTSEDAGYAPSTSERPAIPSGYSTTFSVADIKQRIMQPKHAWSWFASAATGGWFFPAIAHTTHSTSAGSSSRASRPPFTRLCATRPLSGKGNGSGSISNDGRKSNFNRSFSISAAAPSASDATHGEPKTSWWQKPHLLSAEIRSISEGVTPVDAMESARGGEEAGEEADEVVMTAVSSGAGLWASRAMLAGAAMLYGTNFGCVKLLEETVPMSLAAALRFTVAVIPFLPFLIKINPGVFRAGVKIGLFDAVGFYAQSKSLTTTAASKVAFICSLSVILVPLMDTVFGAADEEGAEEARATDAEDKKRQGVVFSTLNGPWFPALLAMAGVACLELVGVESSPSSGDAWALVQPLCFGVVFWLTERSSRKYPGDTLGIVAAHLLAVAVLAIGWSAQAGQFPISFESFHQTIFPSSGSLAVPLSLLWVGLVTTSMTVFLETLAMEKVSAAESAVIFSTEPIWGTAFAAVLLRETIGWNTVIAAILIVLACTWSSVGPAIQCKVLTFIASGGVGGTSAWTKVDDDDLIETVRKERHRSVRHAAQPL